MKEIGGYFGLEQLVDNAHYKHLLALNTGRNALLYLIRAKDIRKIYIPYYLCDSVSNMLQQHGCSFYYYHIDANFNPIFNQSLEENAFLYVVNYYGQLENAMIESLKQRYERIIVDNTQAFFQEPVSGVDTIYSCRKFFGVPDGAYLSTDSVLDDDLVVDVSKDRMGHILGRYEGSASEYYDRFQENDASFRFEPLEYMSKLTRNILGAIDYDAVRRIREQNYAYLQKMLGALNRLIITSPPGPFAYPFYLENGVAIRRHLAEKRIYVPTLWPNVSRGEPDGSVERDYATNILPLPCDQRYSIGDMEYMVRHIQHVVEHFCETSSKMPL